MVDIKLKTLQLQCWAHIQPCRMTNLFLHTLDSSSASATAVMSSWRGEAAELDRVLIYKEWQYFQRLFQALLICVLMWKEPYSISNVFCFDMFWIYSTFSQLGYWCRHFVMIPICAQPAPTQIFPLDHCVCLRVEVYSGFFSFGLKAIQEGILPLLQPTHPICIKLAVLGIHQVSITPHTLDLMSM